MVEQAGWLDVAKSIQTNQASALKKDVHKPGNRSFAVSTLTATIDGYD